MPDILDRLFDLLFPPARRPLVRAGDHRLPAERFQPARPVLPHWSLRAAAPPPSPLKRGTGRAAAEGVQLSPASEGVRRPAERFQPVRPDIRPDIRRAVRARTDAEAPPSEQRGGAAPVPRLKSPVPNPQSPVPSPEPPARISPSPRRILEALAFLRRLDRAANDLEAAAFGAQDGAFPADTIDALGNIERKAAQAGKLIRTEIARLEDLSRAVAFVPRPRCGQTLRLVSDAL